MDALKHQRSFLILLCFAAVLFLSDIWAYKEFVRAESYFAVGAKLMIEEGNWLTPHAPDELPLNKPPLTYWLIAASYKLFGVSYGASRLPSALAALATLVLVYFWSSRMVDQRTALVAVAILGTSYLFMNFARLAMSDMLLTFFVTASLTSFIKVLAAAGEKPNRFVYLAYIALALGILTKGPVALALVILPVAFELLISRRRDDFKKLRIVHGVVLMVFIAAPYFLLVYLRRGATPLEFFFIGENLRRFIGQIYTDSGRPIWYEFAALFGDFAPWSLLLPLAAWVDWKAWREKKLDRTSRSLYLWLGAALLLFSLSSFKLDYYLLPIMPAAALIVAPVITKATTSLNFVRRIVKLAFAFIAIVAVIVALVSLRAAEALAVNNALRLVPLSFAAVTIAATAYCIVRRSAFSTALVLCACIIVMMLSFEVTLLPAFTRFLPTKHLVSAVPARTIWFTSSSTSDWANDLAFNLAAGHRVERLAANDEMKIREVIRTNPEAAVLVREQEFQSPTGGHPGLRILSQAETYGHGGLNSRIVRHPQRERLLVIGADR